MFFPAVAVTHCCGAAESERGREIGSLSPQTTPAQHIPLQATFTLQALTVEHCYRCFDLNICFVGNV